MKVITHNTMNMLFLFLHSARRFMVFSQISIYTQKKKISLSNYISQKAHTIRRICNMQSKIRFRNSKLRKMPCSSVI